MNAIMERTVQALNGLDENKQLRVFMFIESLANGNAEDNDDEWLPYSEDEMEEDIRLYDEAKANDDGFRISHDDLLKRYGIKA